MKRDWDLIRELLIAIEDAQPDTDGAIRVESLEVSLGTTEKRVEHVALLHEKGLIDAVDVGKYDERAFLIRRLTWEGHDFLEAARDDTRWNRAKAKLAKGGKGITYETLKAVLVELMKAAVRGDLPL